MRILKKTEATYSSGKPWPQSKIFIGNSNLKLCIISSETIQMLDPIIKQENKRIQSEFSVTLRKESSELDTSCEFSSNQTEKKRF